MIDGDVSVGAVRELLAEARGGVVPIVAAGDPVLRSEAARYSGQLDSETFAELIEVMRATMHDAPGVGLAAPQIGIPLQIAVIEDRCDVEAEVSRVRERTPLPFRVLVNPRYTPVGSRTAGFYEGCLSVPGYQAVVTRAAEVRLECTDEAGREIDEVVAGWPARIVAHETDHLHGTLYIDTAHMRSLTTSEVYGELWSDPTPERAAQALGFTVDLG
ncbi:peptide deformylase [Rhodococcus sp. IEGM 1401]|uniref:Peptide deformylase n=1 Tax=Rhodococcus cercidiphylli TaxID=489916 RepID=A0ABU4AZF9_9NOCA|nr:MULTISPECIES: peptide deformylase [Rhodococcus]MCZ4560008.1 peptide deformylase [Rhodococcus sp. IEGM 1401]MDI9919948.1 peptide deformylase [Rhodococcus sp. IEGM 1372]MDV6231632.1 peptide deformylase [Rhodococcus cercidiphylli]MDV8032589.1 peptide deformylase [Rhodococcus sp. IEGM 1414]